MYRHIGIAAGNLARDKAVHSACNTPRGAILGKRAGTGTGTFPKLGCPHHFEKYGIGANTYVRCDYCGTEMEHEPGDPTIWR